MLQKKSTQNQQEHVKVIKCREKQRQAPKKY